MAAILNPGLDLIKIDPTYRTFWSMLNCEYTAVPRIGYVSL